MGGVNWQRKQKVLFNVYDVRERGDTIVKKDNLPIWVDDKLAAQSLVREGVLENDPHNNDKDCYKAGPNFEQGLRRYGIQTGCLMEA